MMLQATGEPTVYVIEGDPLVLVRKQRHRKVQIKSPKVYTS